MVFAVLVVGCFCACSGCVLWCFASVLFCDVFALILFTLVLLVCRFAWRCFGVYLLVGLILRVVCL